MMQDEAPFTKTIIDAIRLAEAGRRITSDIVVREPDTGYCYIKKGATQNPESTLDALAKR